MTRGMPPKPTALRILEGNRGHRPIPEQVVIPPPCDMPEPPAHLHAYAVEEWNRVAADLYGIGLLTSFDRAALAGYCQAYARWREAEEELAKPESSGLTITTANGNTQPNPVATAANAAMRDMLKFAGEFGMTPVARARIDGKARQGEDPIQTKYGIR